MVVFGVAVVVIAGANSGNAGPTPPVTALGFPPATLAGNDFMAADSGRGISQTLGRVASVGDEIVAVGSQSGARIPRAQFFVSLNDGRSWAMGTVRSAGGGVPPPGHGAIFVAGRQGAWVALGPGSIWTSADGRTWTLAPGTGLPLLPGDRISDLARTAAGFVAVGANVPAANQAGSTPLVFLSANGISWQRLDAARLHLAAGAGRVLDVKSVAAAGQLILIAGDVVTTEVTGKPKRTVTVEVGAAWLSGDGGSTWVPTAGTATGPARNPPGPGAQPQVAGVAAVGGGFVLLRPATVAARPAVDAYFSPNGLAWTFTATLGAAGGFAADLANGGPGGAVVTGREGRTLTAFVSANGRTWQQRSPFGTSTSQTTSGVALAADGAVVTAGVSAGQDSRQPVLALVGQNTADQVDIAKIPGATEAELAVNALAAQGSMQVAVGSANGFPAAWTSVDGGSSWTRATGATPAVLNRPGSQQLASVTHGPMGWLAVGGVTASAAEHPVVVVSANGTSWQAADGAGTFGAPGLFTQQAAANGQGYVIVGHQNVRQVAERHGHLRPHRRRGLVVGQPDRLAAGRGRDGGRAGRTGQPADDGGDGQLGRLRRGGLARRPAVGLDLGGRAQLAPGRPAPPGRRHPGRAGARRQHRPHRGRRRHRGHHDGRSHALRGQLVQRRGQLGRVGAPASRGPDVGHGPGRDRRRLHRDRDLRPHPRPSERRGVDIAERVGVAGRRARRTGPDRAGHPGHHRPYRRGQHADRRRLHRLADRRGARLLAVSYQVIPMGLPNTSSRRLARLGRLARTVPIRPASTSATVTPGAGPRSARTTPSGSTSMLRPIPVAARVGGSSGSGTCPTAATHMVFSMARARTSVTQCSSLNSPAAQAAGSTSSSAPATASARDSSPNRTS